MQCHSFFGSEEMGRNNEMVGINAGKSLTLKSENLFDVN